MTFGYSPQRAGVGPARTGITSANVSGLRRRVLRIDGVYFRHRNDSTFDAEQP